MIKEGKQPKTRRGSTSFWIKGRETTRVLVHAGMLEEKKIGRCRTGKPKTNVVRGAQHRRGASPLKLLNEEKARGGKLGERKISSSGLHLWL